MTQEAALAHPRSPFPAARTQQQLRDDEVQSHVTAVEQQLELLKEALRVSGLGKTYMDAGVQAPKPASQPSRAAASAPPPIENHTSMVV